MGDVMDVLCKSLGICLRYKNEIKFNFDKKDKNDIEMFLEERI
jgi:hypothetical protein